eukprot:scaffold12435_cov69-Phaeocystis_antarctica.AAC.8
MVSCPAFTATTKATCPALLRSVTSACGIRGGPASSLASISISASATSLPPERHLPAARTPPGRGRSWRTRAAGSRPLRWPSRPQRARAAAAAPPYDGHAVRRGAAP